MGSGANDERRIAVASAWILVWLLSNQQKSGSLRFSIQLRPRLLHRLGPARRLGHEKPGEIARAQKYRRKGDGGIFRFNRIIPPSLFSFSDAGGCGGPDRLIKISSARKRTKVGPNRCRPTEARLTGRTGAANGITFAFKTNLQAAAGISTGSTSRAIDLGRCSTWQRS